MTALSFTRCYATPFGAINSDYRATLTGCPNLSNDKLSIIADIIGNSELAPKRLEQLNIKRGYYNEI